VGVANGVPNLDANAKVPSAQLPALSFTGVNVLGNEADMLALGLLSVKGTVAVRTDNSKTFILSTDNNPNGLVDWIELLTPGAPVQSVNGQIGVVSLTTDQVSEGGTNKYFSDARAIAAAAGNYLPIFGGTLTGDLTGTAFIKSGGTATQFLKADGSIDNNTYLTTGSADYLPLAGGTLTGAFNGTTALLNGTLTAASIQKTGGTASQFLKADGSVDNNSYLTTASANTSFLPLGGGILTGAINGTSIVLNNNITANGFQTTAGTGTQFLKADGSVDGNTYLTNATISNYLPLSGGTLTGNLNGTSALYSFDVTASAFRTPAGIATQFLKADGSVDANTYLTTSSASGSYLSISGGTLTGTLNGTNSLFSGNMEAAGFMKTGGVSTQFLKADGSIDNNTYLTNQTAAFLPLSGGSLTGTLNGTNAILSNDITATGFKTITGTASQFLKADGSIDNNTYLTIASSNFLPLAGGTLTGALNGTTAVLSSNITATGFKTAAGSSTQFLKADGSLDNTAYLTAASATFLPIAGGTLTGALTGTSFAKTGGTSTQFLKADGSVDNNTYLTTSLATFLPLTGGTLTGALLGTSATLSSNITATGFKTIGGTATQFLKADGSVDANTYLTSAAVGGSYLALTGGSLSGALTGTSFIKSGGAATQFLKADGSVDNNAYLPVSGGTLTGALNGTSAILSSNITASGFKTAGGLSGQFLKADGSLDANVYLTSAAAGTSFLPLSGGALTGALLGTSSTFSGNMRAAGFQTTSGTATQFLKADGSVDNTSYLSLAGGTLSGALNGSSEVLSGNIRAASFQTTSGTSTQFLKADGSVDNNTYLRSNQVAVANGVASLDANSKVPTSQLPALSFTGVNVLSSQASMLTLGSTSVKGTVAVRTDNSNTYILSVDNNPNGLADWIQLLTPGAPVQSVNGQIGTVNLNTDNVSEGATNKYFTNARAIAALTGSYLPLTGGTLSGSVTGTSFIKSGGTGTQFLKADGSVDNNTYLTVSNSNFLPLSGGTLTGAFNGTSANLSGNITAAGFRTAGGVATQFLKADGTLDNNTYLTSSSATFLPLAGGTLTGTLNLRTGSAAAGTAPLKFTAGTNLSSPVAGSMEFDGTNLFITNNNAVRQQVTISDATDEFSATVAQTAFTLTQLPATNSKVKMYINGIRISNTAYNISGKNLTYNAANNGTYVLVASDRIQFDYFY
jgi:hypothetical protein